MGRCVLNEHQHNLVQQCIHTIKHNKFISFAQLGPCVSILALLGITLYRRLVGLFMRTVYIGVEDVVCAMAVNSVMTIVKKSEHVQVRRISTTDTHTDTHKETR